MQMADHHDDHHTGPLIQHTEVEYQPITPELLERYHGHLGPFVAFGALIGEHAIQTYNVPRYFGVEVDVHCPPNPPTSCLVDGLQASLGTTYGKKNIHHIPSKTIQVSVEDRRANHTYVYTIKPSAMQMLEEWENQGMGVEARGHKLFAMNAEEVLNITEK
jgi:formylmethanofuran dehydrogenase subunit E